MKRDNWNFATTTDAFIDIKYQKFRILEKFKFAVLMVSWHIHSYFWPTYIAALRLSRKLKCAIFSTYIVLYHPIVICITFSEIKKSYPESVSIQTVAWSSDNFIVATKTTRQRLRAALKRRRHKYKLVFCDKVTLTQQLRRVPSTLSDSMCGVRSRSRAQSPHSNHPAGHTPASMLGNVQFPF